MGVWGVNGSRVVAAESTWNDPGRWNRKAEKAGNPRIVFAGSLMDWCEQWTGQLKRADGMWAVQRRSWGMPTDFAGSALRGGNDALRLDGVRQRMFGVIDACPWLRFLLLTKRPEHIGTSWVVPQSTGRIGKVSVASVGPAFRRNVGLGVSVACQQDAERNVPLLLTYRDLVPVLFVSLEPLVGPVDLSEYIGYNPMYESTSQGNRSLRSGETRASGDPSGRNDLEACGVAGEPMERSGVAPQGGSSTSGARPRTVFDGKANDGSEKDALPCSSVDMASFQRTNSGWTSGQSQKRQEERQQAGESGVSNSVTEHEACIPDRTERRTRGAQSASEVEGCASGGDSSDLRGGASDTTRTIAAVCGLSQDDLENMPGRAASEATRGGTGLLREEAPRQDCTRSGRTISWCIIGGESGPNARRCDVEWIRAIVDQCRLANVPCLVKQLGANVYDGGVRLNLSHPKGGDPAEWPEDLRVSQFPNALVT